MASVVEYQFWVYKIKMIKVTVFKENFDVEEYEGAKNLDHFYKISK